MVGPDEESKTTNRVGGMDPDFDLEAHRGESLFIGRDLEDARFVGYVGGAAPLKEMRIDP